MTYLPSNLLKRMRNRHLIMIDFLVFLTLPILALIISLGGSLDLEAYLPSLAIATALFLVIKLGIFYQLDLYTHYWQSAGISELVVIITLTTVTTILQTIILIALSAFTNFPFPDLPKIVPIIDGLLTLIIVGGLRFSIRLATKNWQIAQKKANPNKTKRLLIVGAGQAGIALAHSIRNDEKHNCIPVAFIDDDPAKINHKIQGIPVFGSHEQIPECVEALHIERIIIALPSVSGKTIQKIYQECNLTGVPTSIVPSVSDVIRGQVHHLSIREVKIEDLLRREPIKTDMNRITEFLKGKKVLITGAGGSIGSEICRQVINCDPQELILLGHGENSIFNIEQELRQFLKIQKEMGNFPDYVPKLTTFIADLRFPNRLETAFAQYQPDVVFHAAAHKHVPLMELNPPEAISNNVEGTKNLVDLALKYDVQKFVMISTDKAVNPTNVMGASKRVAEMTVLDAAQRTGKHFVVVRFGNVLGSRGSVIPTFTKQIAAGGPVTVTHPEITRFFMTIPEAVQLTLQASVIGHGGEVIMLNMGESVKIVDLAEQLIRLSGYKPHEDIEIKFTGLRPGEKLYEELFLEGEEYIQTAHEKLLIAKNASRMVVSNLTQMLDRLKQAAAENDAWVLIFILEQLVHGYKPQYPQEQTIKTISPSNLTPSNQQVPFKNNLTKTPTNTQTNPLITPDKLRIAIEKQQFKVLYQPIMSLVSSQVIAFESLLRWQHPELGMIPAGDFLKVAEKSSLIIAIGEWVLFEVCSTLKNLEQNHLNFQNKLIPISVNLSSQQLLQPNFVDSLARIIAETPLNNPSQLILEIPEYCIQKYYQTTLDLIPKLKDLGVLLQIDHFSINQDLSDQSTKSLYSQFDGFKLAPSLVYQLKNQTNKRDSQKSIRAIQEMSDQLGVDLIVTGIDNLEQIDQLSYLKCKYGQGYFFAEPIEANKLPKFTGKALV